MRRDFTVTAESSCTLVDSAVRRPRPAACYIPRRLHFIPNPLHRVWVAGHTRVHKLKC